MIQPTDRRTGLRPVHGAVLAGTAIVAVVVAFAAFHFIVGAVAFLVKLAIVAAIFGLVAKFVFRHARGSR